MTGRAAGPSSLSELSPMHPGERFRETDGHTESSHLFLPHDRPFEILPPPAANFIRGT